MPPRWHQTVQVTLWFLHHIHCYTFVKVWAQRVFSCFSPVARVRFGCPKKPSTPVSRGAKLAASERWFLSQFWCWSQGPLVSDLCSFWEGIEVFAFLGDWEKEGLSQLHCNTQFFFTANRSDASQGKLFSSALQTFVSSCVLDLQIN